MRRWPRARPPRSARATDGVELLKRTLRALDRLVFPRGATCLGCGDRSGCAHDWLCDACERELSANWRGDAPLPCAYPLAGAACAYRYRGPVPGMVRALKYGSVRVLSEFMAGDMARACASLHLPEAPLVVPAPMHPRRERRRGYNQAEALSLPLARRMGWPHERALCKTRNTPQQARLSREARVVNLEGSVAVRADVRDRVILLVDDVYTTGATLHACAVALDRAGARAVYALVYARAGSR